MNNDVIDGDGEKQVEESVACIRFDRVNVKSDVIDRILPFLSIFLTLNFPWNGVAKPEAVHSTLFLFDINVLLCLW